jgi:hypothetical protein
VLYELRHCGIVQLLYLGDGCAACFGGKLGGMDVMGF